MHDDINEYVENITRWEMCTYNSRKLRDREEDRNTEHTRRQLNTTQHNELNNNKKPRITTELIASYDTRPGNEVGLFYQRRAPRGAYVDAVVSWFLLSLTITQPLADLEGVEGKEKCEGRRKFMANEDLWHRQRRRTNRTFPRLISKTSTNK